MWEDECSFSFTVFTMTQKWRCGYVIMILNSSRVCTWGGLLQKNVLGFLICNKKMNEMIRDLLFPHVVDVYTDSCFTHTGMSRTLPLVQ